MKMINEAIVKLIWIGKQKIACFPIFKENLRESATSAFPIQITSTITSITFSYTF
jgi:hypothetical protein